MLKKPSIALLALALGGALSAATADEITIGLASEPTAMDPHFHNLGPNNAISVHIFDRLIGQDDRQRLVPGLAT